MTHIPEIITEQRRFFRTQKTKTISYRIQRLKALKNEILVNEQAIYDALKKDFNKSAFESFLSEFGLVISELNLAINHLERWSKPERVKSSMLTFPSKDYIYKDPYGMVLIIGPWNYPFLLTMEPLVMAIAAGNTVVLKPSELTPNTTKLVTEIIEAVFPKTHAAVVNGSVAVATELLAQRWDYIFFTGSVRVGKIVAQAAAKFLTPVTLELGGKSPCIVDDTVDLGLVARRLVWGKFLNAGQTCISPDYVIVKSEVKSKLIAALKKQIIRSYGETPETSPDFPRIINARNVLRLKHMLKDVTIAFGGTVNEETCYVSPTLIDNPGLDSAMMQEEIFGPLLPILTYNTDQDIEDIIWHYEKPLALYVFSKKKAFIKHILKKYSFGGGAINDLLIHFGNHKLPFGGVGASGMGAYHGKLGFDTFSHKKAVSKRGNWIDPPLRYAPYKAKLGIIKWMFKYFS